MLVVIIIVTALVATKNSNTVYHLQTVVTHDAQSLISSARSLINSTSADTRPYSPSPDRGAGAQRGGHRGELAGVNRRAQPAHQP